MKLLIVDTDRDLVEMLTSWLKTLGYEVYRAYTGERAKLEWEEQQLRSRLVGHDTEGCGCISHVPGHATQA